MQSGASRLFTLFLLGAVGVGDLPQFQDVRNWGREDCLRVLTESPWAAKETSIRIVGGVGSGVQGEKEIYNTFYVRLFSARPVRFAYLRLLQLTGNLSEQRKRDLSELSRGADAKSVFERWIVVSVTFRCNDPREQARIERFFQTETTRTMKTRAFLSTDKHPRVELAAYYPPQNQLVGAKFVFPRYLGGEPVVTAEDRALVFEFDTPVSGPELRVRFEVPKLLVGGELEL
ncbi:MAG TPA: hypothetical protein P5568_03185 [Acidobacteriota bacterium]|nr:hypothetical protein [Acidobacteriota bacterium]HRR57421.1 hypothetical protein [Acidobacteriota bacterium]HRV07452.1 hypothetical protein [Acidobacteriota bacterium]